MALTVSTIIALAIAAVAIPTLSGNSSTLYAQTTDALDRYLGRSPCERSETDILKGKVRKGPSLTERLLGRRGTGGGEEPEQRALGKIFDTPPEESLGELGPTSGPIALTEPPPSDILPLGSVGAPPGETGIPGTPGGFGTVLPPPSSSTPVDPTNPGTETPIPAVPEPATWAMMLLGLGLCAASMRNRRKLSAKVSPLAA